MSERKVIAVVCATGAQDEGLMRASANDLSGAFTACSIHVSRALNLSLQTFESWFADHKAQIQIESRLL